MATLYANFLNFDGTVWKTITATTSYQTIFSIDIPSDSPPNYYLDSWSAPTRSGTKSLSPGQKGVRVVGPYDGSSTDVSATFIGKTDYSVNFTPIGGQNVATIYYNPNGGSGAPNDQVIRHGTKYGTITVNLSSQVPVRADHTFRYWVYNGVPYAPGATITLGVSENAHLTAEWERTTYYTTVIYNANGGSGAPGNQVEPHQQTSGTVNVNLNNSILPTRGGWIFGGWTVKGEVKAPGSAITLDFNETVTVYAYWYQNTAQITYDTDGASPMDPTVQPNAQTSGTVSMSIRVDLPTKQYFDFVRWEDSNGNPYQPGQTVFVPYNGTFPLKAVYQKKTVTVHLVSDKGEGNRTITAEQGTSLEIAPMSETGWVFKGWAETDGGQVKYPNIEGQTLSIFIEDKDIYLFAVWNTKFNEETLTLANDRTILLKDVTFYPTDQRTVEIGTGDTDVLLSNLGYSGVQLVPLFLVEQYPLAFGVSPSDMVSPDNPDLAYSNVYEGGSLTVKFDAQIGGYKRGLVKFAVIDVPSMTGFVLSAYLSQETDVTIYTIILSRSNDDENPLVYPDLMGSYRNPYLFTFPSLEIGVDIVDKWVSVDTGYEYSVGETLSLTGRYVTATQTLRYIAKTVRKDTVLAFSPQGGTLGPSAMRERSSSPVTFVIPESGIRKRGATFKGWSDSPNGIVRYSTGDSITVWQGSTMTLYAVWETNLDPFTAQGDLYLPYCGIMIYNRDGGYFNATFLQHEGGLAVISKAENQPGSATFSLDNNIDDLSKSLCSEEFSLWSDGSKGAVKPGMYVRLLDIKSPSEADLIMDGRITTMTPSDDVVSFEIGDGKAFLGKTGTWLRRNYRNAESSKSVYLDGTVRITPPTLDVPLNIKGEAIAAYRVRSTPVDVAVSRSGATWKYNPFKGSFVEAVAGRTFRTIRRLEFTFRYEFINEFYPESSVTFDLALGSRKFGYIGTFTTSRGEGTASISFNMNNIDFNVNEEISLGYIVYGVNSHTIRIDTVTFILDTEETVAVPQRAYTDSLDEQDREDPTHRLRVVYVSESILVKQIMSDMAEALGYGIHFANDIPSTALAIFRAGGSYALSYYQKLADQREEKTFKTMSFEVEGAAPQINVGTRYSMDDEPRFLIKYGGDLRPVGTENLPVLDIHKFSPKITLKNRPNLVTLKANLKDNQSFIVSFEDMDSTDAREGVTIEKLISDSSASNVAGVGSAAFAELSSVELDRWEGEVIVPGIIRGLMSEGDPSHAGSGVPVLLQDRRYGMNSYKARVRQVTYDYSACVTRIILDNYDMMYSSGIASTNALAVEVGDLVGGIADTTLYNQQYLYLKSEEVWVSSDKVTVELLTSDTTKMFIVNAEDVSVFELPNGSVVTACSFTTDAEHYLSEDKSYGVYGVILRGGTTLTIPIPEKRRPDLFLGQTLSICVITKHGGK